MSENKLAKAAILTGWSLVGISWISKNFFKKNIVKATDLTKIGIDLIWSGLIVDAYIMVLETYTMVKHLREENDSDSDSDSESQNESSCKDCSNE